VGGDTFVSRRINSTGTGRGVFIRYLGGVRGRSMKVLPSRFDPTGLEWAVGGFTNSPDFPLKNAIQATAQWHTGFPLNRVAAPTWEAVPRNGLPRGPVWSLAIDTTLTLPLFYARPPMAGMFRRKDAGCYLERRE